MRTDIDTIYIGGEWITPLSTSRIEIRSSAPAARAAYPPAPRRTELNKARDDTLASLAGAVFTKKR
jgi:hypothetical protein